MSNKRQRVLGAVVFGFHNEKIPNYLVGIATRYGKDGPGIESRWGQDFPHVSRPSLGPTQPPIQCVPGLFPEGKAAVVWR